MLEASRYANMANGMSLATMNKLRQAASKLRWAHNGLYRQFCYACNRRTHVVSDARRVGVSGLYTGTHAETRWSIDVVFCQYRLFSTAYFRAR